MNADRTADVLSGLSRAGVAEARADRLTRALYSSDASLYRVPPTVVAFPRHVDEIAACLAVATETRVPLTVRGAGTSVAGNAVGPGIVMDLSRHLGAVLGIDPEARTATVQPGTVQAVLQRAAAPHGLRFGPDPSTSSRATVGGMIGNNACGNRTLGYGRTVDNVASLTGLWGSGQPFRLDAAGTAADATQQRLRDVVAADLATVRTEFGRFGRQVSGYALEHLLPERGGSAARVLVGAEGTLGVITEATVRLVRDPAVRIMVVLGFADLPAAGDAAPAVLLHGPTACEGLDRRLIDVLRARRGDAGIPDLPRGAGWLLVELAGDDAAEVLARATALAGDPATGALETRIVGDPAEATVLWRVREDGAGLAGRAPSGRPAYPGWEDAAVPPDRLGDYLRAFETLLDEHGLTCSPYGHFGDGCLHVRLDVPLGRPGALRAFLRDAAEQVAGFGGSLSGEHGDGRARSELLPAMYSPAALSLFGHVKGVCDPANLLNPGVLVDPAPVDADVRFPGGRPPAGRLAFAWTADGGDLGQAVHRCTGVGKCRADLTPSGGVMCPSYLATREEKDSTRGRARVLQELLDGDVVTGGWRSPQVHDALDMCLSCKGCASDCPTGIDMASYKAEVLHQAYRGRLRPRSHYSLGRLPQWLRLAGRVPSLANRALAVADRVTALKRLAGVDPRRSLPGLAPQSFRSWAASAGIATLDATPPSNAALLAVDTFTEHFTPEVGRALVDVLRSAGYEPVITSRQRCCGLTWISTGQLDAARRLLADYVADLAVAADAGIPIVGVEPSCTAVLRHDAVELLDSAPARRVRDATVTLAELLARTPGWSPPDLVGTTVIAQPHCHHHAIMTWAADERLLRAAGARLRRVGGCCGLAGNFGVEQGHYEVSVAVAEHDLLPAVRDAGPHDVVLADGFSCRTQLADLGGRNSVHLAQLLADAARRAGRGSPAGADSVGAGAPLLDVPPGAGR